MNHRSSETFRPDRGGDAATRVVRSRRVVTPEGVRAASVVFAGGVIRSVGAETPDGAEVFDYDHLVVMPGLVDSHVHVNEPGRTEWEGFETATRAAAAGGVTTIFDMPLNSIPPTTTAAALREKAAAAQGRSFVDVGFWGGIVPGNSGELAEMAALGAPGFKAFLSPSGVPEFGQVGDEELREALTEVARLGAIALVHAEDPDRLHEPPSVPDRSYATYLATRPAEAEDAAVARLHRLARETGARVHVVHLSSAGAIAEIEAAQAAGVSLSAETCPHYLALSAEEVPDGATEFKCAPPIRGRENRDLLWRGLADGAISLVVSDHSPSPPAMKSREAGDFLSAWGGISSLELRLPVVWTAARERGFGIDRLPQWLCAGPARLAGVAGRKGAIAPGFDADLVVWSPETSFRVSAADLHQRHPLTPYDGVTLLGTVEATLLAGETIFERNRFPMPPRGRILLEPSASRGATAKTS